MKRILIVILPLLVCGSLFGTEQVSDKIIIEKDTFEIFNFGNHLKFSDEITNKIYDLNNGWECTGCWRGYIATWEILENKLYLVDIITFKDSNDLKNLVEKTLGKKFIDGRLELTTIDEEFYCGLRPVHCGIFPISEKEYKIRIKNGIIIEKKLYEHNNCNYKYENEIFLNHIYENIDWSGMEGKNFLVSIIVIIDTSGNIISCKRGDEYFYDKDVYNKLNNILLDLPCMQVYTHEGIIQPELKFVLRFDDELKKKYVR